MRTPLFALFLLTGCPSSDKDSTPTDDTSETGETGDTVDTSVECQGDNEECAPGVSGCGGEGQNMLPGSDCLACHSQGSGEREAPPWEVGGTVFADAAGTAGVQNATVRITDATGETVELRTGSSGNFYSGGNLTPPYTVEVEYDGRVVSMGTPAETGACNSCHKCDGEAGGKLYAP